MLLPRCNTVNEETALINRLSMLPRHFRVFPKGVELGANWIDMMVASALLTRTGYWGDSPRERIMGVTKAFPPGNLGGIIRKVSPSGAAFVIYVINGDPVQLRTIRHYFNSGCLVIESHNDRKLRLYDLCEEMLKAEDRARQIGATLRG